MAKRYELTYAQWKKTEPLLPGKIGDPGRSAANNRVFVDGVLWVLRSGTHWSDLPERYGKWKSVHKRFTRWAKSGVWERVFEVLTKDSDNAYLMIDSTIVRAHQQAATRKGGGQGQALGRSRGGLTTKIHMTTDTQGRPLRFLLTGGQVHDAPQAPALLQGFKAQHVIADKGYDSQDILELIQRSGATAVIPARSNLKVQRTHDRRLYRKRNLIERSFNKLKHWRRISTRYDRRSIYFLLALYLVSLKLWWL